MPSDKCEINPDLEMQTPTRKRKREWEKSAPKGSSTCFTNDAYNSTPKKLIVGRRRKTLVAAKENIQPFVGNPCFEIKSISEIAKERQYEHIVQQNPYEVVRKPPKKKKRENEIAEACFENPALNLEVPEKQFNPYEIKRENTITKLHDTKSKCFVNAALNLRSNSIAASRNPFEIQRCSFASAAAANPDGVTNLGMEDTLPTTLQIGLPFVPTLGCRIDFKKLPLSQFGEKLVFSPISIPKQPLSAIREETSVDIGNELDQYQFELENSINEAKLHKICKPNTDNKLTATLENTLDMSPLPISHDVMEMDEANTNNSLGNEHIQCINQDVNTLLNNVSDLGLEEHDSKECAEIEDSEVLDADNNDVTYASESDNEDLDFRKPAPFQRAYRRAEVSNSNCMDVKSKSSIDTNENKHSHSIKHILRKSIRKLIHFNQAEPKKDEPEIEENNYKEKQTNILGSLRQSLQRKNIKRNPLENASEAEISIIDKTERTMKLKSNLMQAEYVKVEQLTNEKKYSLQNGLRRSTRELRQHIMKSVFHIKHEEYDFQTK